VVACWMSSHSWIVKSQATVTTLQHQQPSGNSSSSMLNRNARDGCQVTEFWFIFGVSEVGSSE
jgi:hypothetical protein